MSFFNKVTQGLSSLFGLGKNRDSYSPLLAKAKNFVSGGLNFLNSKPVKKGIDMLTNLTGSKGVSDFYNDAKKYGNIANNLFNGKAADKKVDRLFDRLRKPDPSIEMQNRRQNDQFDFSSIFG